MPINPPMNTANSSRMISFRPITQALGSTMACCLLDARYLMARVAKKVGMCSEMRSFSWGW